MRGVAIEAIVLNGGMFKKGRAAFFRMALITGLVDGIGFQQGPGIAAVGIMTINTGNFAFQQGHMRTALELGALLLVAGKTGFIDASAGQ